MQKLTMKVIKSILSIFLVMALILLISGFGKQGNNGDTTANFVEESEMKTTSSNSSDTELNEGNQEKTEAILQMRIGDTVVSVEWEDNKSVQALKDLCSDEPLVIQMSMYGGFEQVGSIGTSLPRNDRQITTRAGDIVLYSGNQLVVFYGSNSWAYTRLGHITDQDATSMAELLGNGDVTITVSNEHEK
jgi:hypothetical protein